MTLPKSAISLLLIQFRILPLIIGLAVLCGWYFSIDVLKNIFPGFVEMNPLTAINFILLGTWLTIHYYKPFRYRENILKFTLSALVASCAILLFTITFLPEIRLDRQFFRDAIGGNTMAPPAILNFTILIVAAFFGTKADNLSIKISQSLSFLALYVSLIYVCGYIYNFSSLTGSSIIMPMAMHTTLCFFASALSVMLIHPQKGFIRHITERSLGGNVARKIIPLIMVVPFVVGYLRLLGQYFSLYNTEFGAAIHVVTIAVICGICLTYYSKLLNEIDANRTQIETNLRKSESTFSSIFNNSAIGIALFDKQERILEVNPSFIKIFGYTQRELVYYQFRSLTHPDDAELALDSERDLIEGRISTYHVERRFIHKSGRVVWALLTVSTVKDASGNITNLIKQVIDISERKSVEANLIQKSEENQRVLDSSIDVICTIDEEGRFARMSKASKAVWGYDPQELIGKRYMDFVLEEDQALTADIASQIVLGRPVTNFQNRYRKKDGTVVPVIWSAVWSDTENIMFCVAKDGSEKDKLEKELASERKKFEDAFLQAPSCIAVVEGSDFVFKMANPLYLDVCGKRDIIGKTFKEVFPELAGRGSYQRLEEVFHSGEPFSAKDSHTQLYKNHSSTLVDSYFDYVYQPYKNSAGAVEGIFIFANDVTEQVEARHKIEDSERRYRQIIEEMPGAVYTTDSEGRIMLYNKAAVELWGREPEVGKDRWCGSWKIFDREGNEIPSGNCPMAMAIKSGEPVREAEIIIAKPDGHCRHVQAHPFPLFDSLGGIQGAINMLIDITPHKEAEKALHAQQTALKNINQKLLDKNKVIEIARKELSDKAHELERSNEYKSEFLANMSHELRTPLNSVLVLASLLSENPGKNLNARQLEYADVIYKSGADLLTLINDILDLAKIEAGKLEMVRERTFTFSIVEDMQGLFRHIAAEKQVKFTTEVDDGVPDYFLTDKLRLEQVIKNLLSNAFKFTPQGGSVVLSFALWGNGKELSIAVSDTGIGIEYEKKQMIFEAFQQANGSTTRKYGGTGLGLSISKELAAKLGGRIEVKSQINVGSVFTVIHPLDKNVKVRARPTVVVPPKLQEPNEHMKKYLSGKKILIVDDDIRNIYALSAVLNEYGMDYYAATNGLEALKQVDKNRDIDLILMDMMMPEMDGYQAMKLIREEDRLKELPIIALTAKAMLGDAEKCIEAGASDYIAKPYETKHLLSQINHWMSKNGVA